MKRRRRLVLTIAVTALPLTVASAAGIDNLVWGGAHTRAVVHQISDPLSIFGARSPGARSADALRQTKPGHPRALAAEQASDGPVERFLASLRDRPRESDRVQPLLGPDGFARQDADPAGLPIRLATGGPGEAGQGPMLAAFTPGDFDPFPPGGPLPPIGQFPPGDTPPGGTPPGGGPPGGGPPGGGPPGGGPPAGGPVPEPTTWAMMIVAIFSVGAALRWRRKPVDA